jgi:membrane-bound serine protease (ClpP class)
MIRPLAPIIAASLLMASGPRTIADTVTKTNGQKLTGDIVAESEKDVTLQTNLGELLVRTKIARADIAAIQKDAAAQSRYCRIPIHGTIGPDVRADWLARALEQAAGFKANYIVLDIDSPGGSVAEMAKILDLLSKQEKVHTVAHVHRAMSAAAMIAMACRTIVVDSGASIGAAVPWRAGPDGTPRDVEAKFLSSFRALCRANAEMHRHEPLLAQGMMDMDLVLTVVAEADGRPRVVEGRPKGTPGTPLKKAGEILCLSASEARTCGLAAGFAEDAKGLQRVLGTKDWAPVGESVWAFMESRPAAARADEERQQQAQAAEDRREKLAGLLKKADARIEELKKQKDEAGKRVAAVPLECQGELNRIDPRLPAAQQDAKNREIRQRYETAYAEAQNALRRADAELQELQRLKSEAVTRLRDQ